MMTPYDIHPLCALFPQMPDAEFDALCADIKEHGLHQPIILHDDLILDGAHRYRACVAIGVEPDFEPYCGDDIVSFVLSANLHRRHLDAGQRGIITSLAQDWAKAHGHGGDRKSDQEVTLPLDPSKITPSGINELTPNLTSVSDRAAQSSTSESTQKKTDKVAKADPELAAKVAQGTISLAEALKIVKGNKKPGKPWKPKAPKPAQPHVREEGEPDESYVEEGPNLSDLVDELHAENKRLTGLIETASATDLVAEAIKWRAAYQRALAAQSEAMDSAARSQKREKFTHHQLILCGKAVGETDPTKIASAVKAALRAAKEAA